MHDAISPVPDPRRDLPSVDRLLAHELLAAAVAEHGRDLAVEAAREALAAARAQV
jgi:hypothetical protein